MGMHHMSVACGDFDHQCILGHGPGFMGPRYCDMFGYNVGKHWNSVLKRIA